MVKAISVTAISLAALAALGYVLLMSGGKPLSSDLSVVGKGRPALVLAYENYSPTGGEALNRLRKIRSDYDPQLDFAVADLGNPQGRAFADHYQLGDGQAVFLNQGGQPLTVIRIPADEQKLRSLLEENLAAVR